MKKAIVTGANGFIGKTLVRALLKRECKVIALDIKFDNESTLKKLFQQTIHYLLKILPISPFTIKKKCVEVYSKYKDEECDLDYVTNGARERNIKYALSNSLGFGGHNATICFKKFED